MIGDELTIYTKHGDTVNRVNMWEVSKVEFWRGRNSLNSDHYKCMYGLPSPEGHGGWRYFRVP